MQRLERRELIARMDPERDYVTIVRMMLDYEFPWDLYRALELALLRTFAVPSIGRLLHRTGEFENHPQRRYDDSVLMIHAMLYHGMREPRGRAAVEHLNHIHGHYPISNADFLYTLSTFVVVPVRWLRDFGWRDLHPNEERALTLAVIAMGEAMGIRGIPATYDEFELLFDDYEREHFAVDEAGAAVARSVLALMRSWVPGIARGGVQLALLGLLDQPLAQALGLPDVPGLRSLTRAALKSRAVAVRLAPPRADSRPFVLTTRSYPDGFRLEELGPDRVTSRQRVA